LLNDINNIQVSQQIKHRLFDRNNTRHLNLTIYVGYDELSFAIDDEQESGIVFLKSYRLKDANNYFAYKLLLSELLEQEELFTNQYNKISIGLNAANYTLVPHKYYDPSSAERYFDFNVQYDGSSKIMTNFIEGVNCFAIFAMDFQLLETLTNIFGNFILQHAVSYLIPALPTKEGEKRLYANLQKNNMDIVCVDGDKLIFCNTFKFNNPSEYLFHLLNASKQSGIDPDTDQFIILGDINSDQQHYQLSKDYLVNLSFANRPADKKYCMELDIIAPHQHFNLFAIR